MGECLEVAQKLYRAFSAGDMETVRAVLSPDLVWYEAEGYPYDGDNPYLGIGAVVDELFPRIAADWGDWTVTIENMIEAEPYVITQGRYTGFNIHTGKPVDAQMAHVLTIRDGKVAHFQQYADTRQIYAATQP